ncbi:Cyclic GMP-AMP synthase [Anabarilius grahami]|uniref:Cyclic GMP-AMP synthase n=1 Tax=Anabarilius grahami TaxID=495550 RepID=A0A3N0YR63_ANAGA|nr:Cyclic GMP-AMP synthase [Anabarilius grahami]
MESQTRSVSSGTPGDVSSISPQLDRLIRHRSRDLRLRKVDQQSAVKIVNHLIESLLEYLKNNEDHPFFRDVSVLTSGSYYEMVKINKPNEFDIMLKLKVPRLELSELEEYQGLFYKVKLVKATRKEIQHFLLEDERTISATKIKEEMHRLVRKFINNHFKGKGWVINRKLVNSPAVTLEYKNKEKEDDVMSVDIVPTLEVPQGWPQAARAGPNIDNWLGKKCRRQFVSKAVYFVPKRPKGRNLKDDAKESWRISFSHIEKEMMQYHGNKKTCCETPSNKCCRKRCLQLLKCLIEGLKQRYPKELEPLCSYHGKTAFFHVLSDRVQDSLWSPGQMSVSFMKLFGYFERRALDGSLLHFFVRQHNLFSPPAFPKRALAFLTNALKEQRELEFPVLKVPSPSAALVPDTDALIHPNPINGTDSIVASEHYFRHVYAWLVVVIVCVGIGCVFV